MAAAGSDGTRDKRAMTRFYYAKLLPKTLALKRSIAAGSSSVMALDAERF